MAIKVVAANFELFPHMSGVEDPNVGKEIVKLIDKAHPVVVTALNVDFEFYWEDKCKS